MKNIYLAEEDLYYSILNVVFNILKNEFYYDNKNGITLRFESASYFAGDIPVPLSNELQYMNAPVA